MMFRVFKLHKPFYMTLSRKCLNYNFANIKDFENMTNFFKDISNTNSRKSLIHELKEFLTEYLKQSDKELTFSVVRILTGYIEKSKDLQIGPSTLLDIVSNLFPLSKELIASDLKSQSDIGLLASNYMKKYNNITKEIIQPLEIKEILTKINEIANIKGKGTKSLRLNGLLELCKKCRNDQELMYLLRIFKKNLRLGYTHLTVFKAFEMIKSEGNIPDFEDLLIQMEDKIFGFRMDFNTVNTVKLGIPLSPMKGRPIDDISDIFKTFKKYDGNILCEIKYDGERGQIHYQKGKILSFSRNFEPQYEKYKNVLDQLKIHLESLGIENCIIDSEIIGFDYNRSQILTFQELQTKKENSSKLEEKIYFFDLYYLNNQSLLNEPLPIRRKKLLSHFKSNEYFTIAEGIELNLKAATEEETVFQINDFLSETLQQGYEGVIIKTLDPKLSLYNGNSRTQWIKIKKSSLKSELSDTLDLIPIAGFWGKGKRKGAFGTYLVAAYDPKSDIYEAICKLGTGFSDEFLKETTEKLLSKSLDGQPVNYLVSNQLKPDVWFEPSQVWEIAGDCFTLSNIYTVGKDYFDKKGISLRFPRFIRLRDDKAIGQSTEIGEVINFYKNQKKAK